MYRVEVERRAARETERYPSHDLKNILDALDRLAAEPRLTGAKKLTAQEGYRLRVGAYRILYYIDDSEKLVTIYRIKRRSESTYR